MFDNAWNFVAGGAILGVVASLWDKIKAFAWRVANLFVQRIEIPNQAAHDAVTAYLISKYRRSRNYDRMYGAAWEFQRDGRYGLIPYEQFGHRNLIFWNGWFPFFFANQQEAKSTQKAGESHNHSAMKIYSTLTFVRGTLDVEKILAASCDERNAISWAAEDQQEESKTRFVIHHVPKRNDSENDNDYGSNGLAWYQQGTYRLIAHSPGDLGKRPTANGKALDNLIFPQRIKDLIHEIGLWRKSRDWYREKGIPWKRGWMLGLIAWGVCTDSLTPNPALAGKPAVADAGGKPYRVATADADGKAGTKELAVPAVVGLPVDQSGYGNLEGQELRFGHSATPTWAALTTCTSNGSVNGMHDSLNPLAGLTPLTGMWLNCNFGGIGVGLINFLIYLIVAVFLAGLMVGRTPEYLGKKVEAREMKLAAIALLVHPFLILVPTGLFAALDWGAGATNNPGPHGFSEILYEFTSSSANNGSGFEGLGDTFGFNDPKANPSPPATYAPHYDVACGLVMVLGRFIPIIAPIAFAASLAAKRPTPFTAGTLRTDTVTFGVLLFGTVVLLGALMFLPVAALGPIAEHLGPIPFGG